MLFLPENLTCGYFDCSEFTGLNTSPERKVLKYEIEFYLEDAKSTYCDGREYSIKQDFIQIAKPGQIRYSTLPFKTLYIKFSATDDLAKMLDCAPEYFHSSHADRIKEKLREIIALNESDENQLLLYSRILSLINLILIDASIPNTASENYPTIAKAKRFIEENYAKPIQLFDIASAVNLSPSYFHTNFTAAVGISPHDYLIRYRIDASKRMLWDTTIGMDVIAEKCGFTNQQYFSKIFKKQTGLTPGQYRKEFQKNYTEE